MRGLIAAAGSIALAASSMPAQAWVPDYVPTGADLYDGYEALAEPRADLPVGALWVQGFGPHGEGASPDNVVSVRSLSGITMNREMELRLTLGLLKFLNVDPGLRNRLSARFADITIVRVKDMTKLAGPSGEPRIYEALRAGTINVTLDKELGADIGNSLGSKIPVLGRGDSGLKRSLTLDGKDLFIAYRVATPKLVAGEAREIWLDGKGPIGAAEIGDYRVAVDASALQDCACPRTAAEADEGCAGGKEVEFAVSKPNPEAPAETVVRAKAKAGEPAILALPVPVADGKGGLFTSLSAMLTLRAGAAGAAKAQDGGCPASPLRKSRLTLMLRGERLETLKEPKAPGW